jgi:hypothetical protein
MLIKGPWFKARSQEQKKIMAQIQMQTDTYFIASRYNTFLQRAICPIKTLDINSKDQISPSDKDFTLFFLNNFIQKKKC